MEDSNSVVEFGPFTTIKFAGTDVLCYNELGDEKYIAYWSPAFNQWRVEEGNFFDNLEVINHAS